MGKQLNSKEKKRPKPMNQEDYEAAMDGRGPHYPPEWERKITSPLKKGKDERIFLAE